MIGYLLVILCLITFYNFNKIKKGYNLYLMFKNTVDPENKKNCCTLSFDICKVFYKLLNPPTLPPKFNDKHLKVPYEYKDGKYFFLLKVPKGIMPIDIIKDENENDVTDEVLPYLGPNLDCHGNDIYPSDFGLKKIYIKNINEKEYTFEENEKIIL